jgi:hypothetical protein
MNLLFLHPAGNNRQAQSDTHPVVHNEPSHNMNEGSEFLDDAIRIEDLPIIYTEESIAVSSPKNLL